MDVVGNNAIVGELEALRRVLPDPFDLPTRLDVFFDHQAAQKLIADASTSTQRIIGFLEKSSDPALVRVAVLLLSRFKPTEFYHRLLAILEKSDKPTVEAFETGLWLIRLPQEQIAKDLVDIVDSSENPNPLLLLQRPVAKVVRPQLAGFVKQRRLPLSLYALHCYGYAMETEDVPLMEMVSKWVDVPEMSALAGLYLLKLGHEQGTVGIRAGLTASSQELRMLTYYELARYLPKQVVERSGYDPGKLGNAQESAIDILISHLASSK